MKSESPIKKKLLDFSITPIKVTVDNEINGWMETHKKQQSLRQLQIRRPPKVNQLASIKPVTQDRSSLAILRERQLILLRSSAKKAAEQPPPTTASEGSSLVGTAERKTTSQVRIRSIGGTNRLKIQSIEVSEFQSPNQEQEQKRQKAQWDFNPCIKLPEPPRFPVSKLRFLQSRGLVLRDRAGHILQRLESNRQKTDESNLQLVSRRLVSINATVQ